MKREAPKPTNAELAILQLLWQLGPSTVRQIHRALDESRQTGYTTALKLLQIMTEKGLVERDETQRPQVYRARLSQEQTQKQLVSDLLEKAFGGSAKQLVMQALSVKEASEEELTAIERLLDKLEGGER